MGQKVTIGGDRLGSGRKMQANLHNYFRSTHNLSEKFASSASCGVLYPALCKLGMRGDSFDISIQADARTIPTKGPLFGSYKMQVDVFQCPVRLYQGILHNNPLAIGLNMKQVYFPQIQIENTIEAYKDQYAGAMSKSSLCHYLGFSGIGRPQSPATTDIKLRRYINALPFLSYYDIFKTYYANKQEDNAWVIAPTNIRYKSILNRYNIEGKDTVKYNTGDKIKIPFNSNPKVTVFTLYYSKEAWDAVDDPISIKENITIDVYTATGNAYSTNAYEAGMYGLATIIQDTSPDNEWVSLTFVWNSTFEYNGVEKSISYIDFIDNNNIGEKISDIALTPFKLSNIDDMRYDLLSNNRLGAKFTIGNITGEHPQEGQYLPYSVLTTTDWNKYSMNGLVLKTYQNDIFNNWLNTDWIEGENSINEITQVAVTDGKFSMDALNFAQKLYNMLNRIAVAGATYEDWQDVVYEEVKRRQIESPIFCGGISQEIMFDEIVQTAPANGDPLGTLGGRGRLIPQTKKGGKIHIKCDEACFIIAIVSLTPRIFYTQGNEFYLTDIITMDDLHKPAMDGIGFQDLIGERLAWWDTRLIWASPTNPIRSKIGKLPAWIEYMTSYDRAHGDFAEEEGKGYMILNRNYERDGETGGIKDATTYIDPHKYNYAFAYNALDAQNFWLEIAFNIQARRLMSARMIPSV